MIWCQIIGAVWLRISPGVFLLIRISLSRYKKHSLIILSWVSHHPVNIWIALEGRDEIKSSRLWLPIWFQLHFAYTGYNGVLCGQASAFYVSVEGRNLRWPSGSEPLGAHVLRNSRYCDYKSFHSGNYVIQYGRVYFKKGKLFKWI